MKSNCSIAIIGLGQFGQLVLDILNKHKNFDLYVISSKKISQPAVTQIGYSKLVNIDFIIPCVPIRAFETTIKKIAPFLKPGSCVIDVCSVKILPVTIMKKYLPKEVQIVATHPLFGPNSVKENKGLNTLKIAFCPVRVNQKLYDQIKKFCRKIGLQLIDITPEEHDQTMAFTQAFSFLIGKISDNLDIRSTPLDTLSFSLLQKQNQIIQYDDELFKDIFENNPYCESMLEKFSRVSQRIIKNLA